MGNCCPGGRGFIRLEDDETGQIASRSVTNAPCERSTVPVADEHIDGSSNASGHKDGSACIFWDIENCGIPFGVEPAQVVKNLRSIHTPKGFKPTSIIATAVLQNLPLGLGHALVSCGVTLLDCASTKPSASDFLLLEEMFQWTWSHSPPNSGIILVTSDKDFGRRLTFLSQVGYDLLLIHQPTTISETLKTAVDHRMLWPYVCRLHQQQQPSSSQPLSLHISDACRRPPVVEHVQQGSTPQRVQQLQDKHTVVQSNDNPRCLTGEGKAVTQGAVGETALLPNSTVSACLPVVPQGHGASAFEFGRRGEQASATFTRFDSEPQQLALAQSDPIREPGKGMDAFLRWHTLAPQGPHPPTICSDDISGSESVRTVPTSPVSGDRVSSEAQAESSAPPAPATSNSGKCLSLNKHDTHNLLRLIVEAYLHIPRYFPLPVATFTALQTLAREGLIFVSSPLQANPAQESVFLFLTPLGNAVLQLTTAINKQLHSGSRFKPYKAAIQSWLEYVIANPEADLPRWSILGQTLKPMLMDKRVHASDGSNFRSVSEYLQAAATAGVFKLQPFGMTGDQIVTLRPPFVDEWHSHKNAVLAPTSVGISTEIEERGLLRSCTDVLARIPCEELPFLPVLFTRRLRTSDERQRTLFLASRVLGFADKNQYVQAAERRQLIVRRANQIVLTKKGEQTMKWLESTVSEGRMVIAGALGSP